MRVRLPNLSSTVCGPIWQTETSPHSLSEKYPNPSIHQGDFLHHSFPPIPSFKSKTSAYISRLPISTVHVTGPIHDPFDKPCRRSKTRRGHLECGVGSMDEISNYQQEFTLKAADRPVNYKPVEVALKTEEPFVASSLYRSQFKRWKNAPLSAPQPATECKSVSRSPSHRSREQPAMRPHNLRPFAAETSYSIAFKHPIRGSSAKHHSMRHWTGAVPGDDLDVNRVQPKGPFSGVSIYREDYIPKASDPPKVLQNLSALTYDSSHRPPSRVQPFVEHADHVFYNT